MSGRIAAFERWRLAAARQPTPSLQESGLMFGMFSKAAIIGCVLVMTSGCTASSWISAAGAMANAQDDFKKKRTLNKIKAANQAASKKK